MNKETTQPNPTHISKIRRFQEFCKNITSCGESLRELSLMRIDSLEECIKSTFSQFEELFTKKEMRILNREWKRVMNKLAKVYALGSDITLCCHSLSFRIQLLQAEGESLNQ